MTKILTAILFALLLPTTAGATLYQFHVTSVTPPDVPPEYELFPPAIEPGPTLLVLDLPAEGAAFGTFGACFGPDGELARAPGFSCDPGDPDKEDPAPVLLEYELQPSGDGGWLGFLFADFFQGDNQFRIARAAGEDLWTGWWGYDDLANVCSWGPEYCAIEGIWQLVSSSPAAVPEPGSLGLILVGVSGLLAARRHHASVRAPTDLSSGRCRSSVRRRP